MTAKNARAGVILIEDAAHNFVDASGTFNQINPQATTEEGTYNVFGKEYVQRLLSHGDLQLSGQVVFDDNNDSGFQILNEWINTTGERREHRRVQWKLADGNIGANYWDGYFYLTAFAYTADPTQPGPIMATFTMKQIGIGITEGKVAT